MRLLADENVPATCVAELRSAGHDVTAIAEDVPRARDVDVLRIARDSERVLVKFDRDFGELIYRYLAPVPPGVIYLRITAPPAHVTAVLLSFLENPEMVVPGCFSVLTTDTVRQRGLDQ